VGTVTFTRSATASDSADPTDRGSGCSVTLTTASGARTTLSFSTYQFVNDVNVDVPAICLQ